MTLGDFASGSVEMNETLVKFVNQSHIDRIFKRKIQENTYELIKTGNNCLFLCHVSCANGLPPAQRQTNMVSCPSCSSSPW